jgi:hypothetical protein
VVPAALVLAGLAVMSAGAASPPRSPASPAARSGVKAAPRPAAVMRPDFSGTWVLDTARSEFGQIPGGRPLARTDVIVHRDPQLAQTLYLRLVGGPDTTRYRYATDSTRAVHRVENRDIEAHVWWAGDTLRLESMSKLMMFEMWLRERWTLSPDGRTLTMSRHITYPLGKGDQKLLFVKQ